MGFFSRIAENKTNKLIFTILAIVLAYIAMILGMLCIFAGHQVDMMEDYHILTVSRFLRDRCAPELIPDLDQHFPNPNPSRKDLQCRYGRTQP
jgi:hypothetical protein